QRWRRQFAAGLKSPATLIISPAGKVIFQHEGPLDQTGLTAALHKFLIKGPPLQVRVARSSAIISQLPPNFLFEHTKGQGFTLRKLTGRRVILVFWKSTSAPSIEAVKEEVAAAAKSNAAVLAINDGESVDVAEKSAKANRLTATLVTDPQRDISGGYN